MARGSGVQGYWDAVSAIERKESVSRKEAMRLYRERKANGAVNKLVEVGISEDYQHLTPGMITNQIAVARIKKLESDIESSRMILKNQEDELAEWTKIQNCNS